MLKGRLIPLAGGMAYTRELAVEPWRVYAISPARGISLLLYLTGQKIAGAMPVLNCLIRQKIARAVDVQTRPFARSRCLLPLPAPVAIHVKAESLAFELAFALDELVKVSRWGTYC